MIVPPEAAGSSPLTFALARRTSRVTNHLLSLPTVPNRWNSFGASSHSGGTRSSHCATPALALFEEVDQRLQLGREVHPARVVKEVARNLRAILFQHPHEPFLSHELLHHALEHVRQPEPVEGSVDEHGSVVRDDVPLYGDLEVLALLDEPPAIYSAARLAQIDAVVDVQVARARRPPVGREVCRRANHHDSLVDADTDCDHFPVEGVAQAEPRVEPLGHDIR